MAETCAQDATRKKRVHPGNNKIKPIRLYVGEKIFF